MSDREHPGRRALTALFVIYLVLLTWIVLWKLAVPWVGAAALLARPIKLVPFLPSGYAGASAPLEVVANIALFVPFGVYLRLLAPSWRWRAVGVFAGASLLLECAQHLLSTGSFDTSDVIANTVGGLAGVGLFALARHAARERTVAIVSRTCLVATVVSILAVGAFVASPLRYEPQHDVIVPTPSAFAAAVHAR